MEVSIIKNFSDLQNCSEAWRELLKSDPEHTIFQTPEWVLSCYTVFEKDSEIATIIVKDNDKFVGLAPLIIKNRKINGIKRRTLMLIGSDNYASDYCKIIIADKRQDVLKAIFSAINNLGGWQTCDLFNITSEADLELANLQKMFEAEKIKCLRYRQIETASFIISSPESVNALLNHGSLKRHTKYFQKEGELKFLELTDFSEIKPWLDQFYAQHIERWKETNTQSLFNDQRQQIFYNEVAEKLCPLQALVFTVILFNNSPIAFHFGFNYQRIFYWYKPSFDIKYEKHSPGEVLQQALFEYTVGHGLQKFDFTIGDESFKYRFANTFASNERLLIYRHNFDYFVGLLRLYLSALKHRKSKRIK